MLRIEDYIARRKKEDGLNEFDVKARAQNMKLVVDYVFEYFNNYLDITKADEKTVLHDDKVEKYRKHLGDYEHEVREWAASMYDLHGNQINRYVGNWLKNHELFFLFSTDAEFRSLSYECYTALIRKLPFLKDQTEMLFLFLKEYHRVESQGTKFPSIAEPIDIWLETTWKKYQVNLATFAYQRANWFFDNEDIWPITHRKKTDRFGPYKNYDYDHRQKSNLFNLDSLYRKMPKKAFVKGRKQEFEIIIMYYWIHEIYGDVDYWDEYLLKVLPGIENK